MSCLVLNVDLKKKKQLSALISPLFLLYCHDVFDEFRDPLVKSSTLNCFQRANLLRTQSLGKNSNFGASLWGRTLLKLKTLPYRYRVSNPPKSFG